MALSSEERHRRADRDLREKLRLEAELSETWGDHQRRTARAVAASVESTGAVAGVAGDRTREAGSAILERHYGAVQAAFPPPELPATEREGLDDALAEAFRGRATAQAGLIADTDQRDARLSLEIAEAERARLARDEGSFLTRAGLAAIVGVTLLRRMRGRLPTIANVETQEPAELTKLAGARIQAAAPLLTEAAETLGLTRTAMVARVALGATSLAALAATASVALDRLREPPAPTKAWVDVGDEKVRAWHAEATRTQTAVPIEEPFLVRGERLMHPGDTSLGASFDNVVNCRCAAVYG